MDNSTVDGNYSFALSCPNDAVCMLEAVAVILVSSLILVANAGNLAILLSTPSLRNSHGYLLMSLSVADLGVGCVASLSVYPSASLRGSAESWPYGDSACLVAAYAGQLALMNSGLDLMLLSVERYIAVAHPLKYSRLVTKKTTASVIASCWLLTAAAFSTMLAGVLPHSYAPQLYVCQSLFVQGSVFALVLVFVAVVPGVSFMLVTTAIVSRKLKESARLRAAAAPTPTPSSSGSQDSNSGSTLKKSIGLSRTVRVMTVAVILHMFPFMTVLIITATGTKVHQVISFASYWWLIANSFVNSGIYYLKTTKFRERMDEITNRLIPGCFTAIDGKMVYTCRCRKRHSTPPPPLPYETHANANVELVVIRRYQSNGIENRGFQGGRSPLAANHQDESQVVNRL